MEQQQNFTEIQIRQLIKDICTALLETHKLKRAHLNIKPGNNLFVIFISFIFFMYFLFL